MATLLGVDHRWRYASDMIIGAPVATLLGVDHRWRYASDMIIGAPVATLLGACHYRFALGLVVPVSVYRE